MSCWAKTARRLFIAGVTTAGASLAGYSIYRLVTPQPTLAERLPKDERKQAFIWRPPSRAALIKKLAKEPFDLLIVGGGATGSGCALDAAARGLKVACVERDDFSSGTSSKSTKLIHGGIRQGFPSSYLLGKTETERVFPQIRKYQLVGSIVYYDGSQYDARMNVSLALKAIYRNATMLNYIEVVDLLKDANGKINGAVVLDKCTGQRFSVKCKGVINATGPYTDSLRKLDDSQCQSLVCPSQGTHLMLPDYYSPRDIGLVDAASKDGRVIFLLPWQGQTIGGTTDLQVPLTDDPKATKLEVGFLKEEIQRSLNPAIIKIADMDVKAAWAGIRPLLRNPHVESTQELVRNHAIFPSSSGLLSISGGKWTTYRSMAEHVIDEAIKQFGLEPIQRKSPTRNIPLIGSHAYEGEAQIVKLLQVAELDKDVAEHIVHSYGDRASLLAMLADSHVRLYPKYPYLEAEVRYACRYEYALKVADVLGRRTRLAQIDCSAAESVLERVATIMQEELNWSASERAQQISDAKKYLGSCGSLIIKRRNHAIHKRPLDHAKVQFLSDRPMDITVVRKLLEDEFNISDTEWAELRALIDGNDLGVVDPVNLALAYQRLQTNP
ncbi:unnamed protein product [Sphagnum compactum]